MATTTHNSESREVRELTERELNDDAVSGGSFVWEAELNPVSKMFHGSGGNGERFLKIGVAEAAGF